MSFVTLRGLLETHMATFAAAQSLHVAYENQPFKPESEETFLRSTLMLSEPRAAACGVAAQDYQRGVYQVDIYGIANKGWGPVAIIGDALRVHFKRGSKHTGNGVTLTCESVAKGPAMIEGNRYRVPMSITFYAYMEPAA